MEYIYNVKLSYKIKFQIASYLKNPYLAKIQYNDLRKEKYIDFKDFEDSIKLIKNILKFLHISIS